MSLGESIALILMATPILIIAAMAARAGLDRWARR